MKPMVGLKKQLALSIATILGMTSSGTFAQVTTLEEIIVTATKKAKSLQDIAVTVTAFDADTIQIAGINDASDLAVLTPSLNVSTTTTPFNSRITIRGIGTAGSTYLEPSVGVFVDGVYLNRSGLAISDLTDIEQIEVLHGPQGTLYGKNTNGGAISITTRAPNLEESEGYVAATLGDYSMRKITAGFSAPLSDTLAFRLSANSHDRDGYLKNQAGEDINDANEWNVIGKLLWQPGDDLSILLKASRIERDTLCCAPDTTADPLVNQIAVSGGFPADRNDPFDHETTQNTPNTFELESSAASLHVEYTRDWGTITSITSWDDYDVETFQEASRSVLDIVKLNEPQSGNSFTQELRFSTQTDNAEYQAGLFYFQQETRSESFNILGTDFLTAGTQILSPSLGLIAAVGDTTVRDNLFETETLALFTRATWHLSDRWHLTGGLRWSDEEKDADLNIAHNSTALVVTNPAQVQAIIGTSLGLPPAAWPNIPVPATFVESAIPAIDAEFNRNSRDLDWLASLSFDINDDVLLFASASTGIKSGGFNGVVGGPNDREFDDEETTSYELGIKATLLDARLRVNSTLFLTEIESFQSIQQAPSGLGRITSNQGEVEISGLDLQLDALPLPNLTLTAGLQYLNKHEFTAGPDTGLDVVYAPDFSYNLAATLVFPVADGTLYVRTDYAYMDDHSVNSASLAQLEAKDIQDRSTLNLNVGWRNDNWNVSVWSRNLTDDNYAASTLTPFPLTDADTYFLAPPRTYGLSARYDF